jgi:hypothetical protein
MAHDDIMMVCSESTGFGLQADINTEDQYQLHAANMFQAPDTWPLPMAATSAADMLQLVEHPTDHVEPQVPHDNWQARCSFIHSE